MFSTIPVLIAEIQAGRLIILMDDEDRENEGDLIMAAQKVTSAHINFMIREGRGLLCLPVSEAKARHLELPLMVSQNQSRYETNFTVSIEAAEGVTTGISVADRVKTILTVAHPEAKASDLVRPGHLFPIIAREGGVLKRPGHTEAVCDLMVLAGFEPCGVLIEILNEDGSMARKADLKVFAERHGLKVGTIADLVAYRLAGSVV